MIPILRNNDKQTLSENTSASLQTPLPTPLQVPSLLAASYVQSHQWDSRCRRLGSVRCRSFPFAATSFLLSCSSTGSSTGHRTFGVTPHCGSPLSLIRGSLLRAFFGWLFALAPAQTATCALALPWHLALCTFFVQPCSVPLHSHVSLFLQHPSCLASLSRIS